MVRRCAAPTKHRWSSASEACGSCSSHAPERADARSPAAPSSATRANRKRARHALPRAATDARPIRRTSPSAVAAGPRSRRPAVACVDVPSETRWIAITPSRSSEILATDRRRSPARRTARRSSAARTASTSSAKRAGTLVSPPKAACSVSESLIRTARSIHRARLLRGRPPLARTRSAQSDTGSAGRSSASESQR